MRGVVSSTGSVSTSTSYDAWGNPETTGGLSAETPFGFAGGYTDPSGLVYLIGRYYDPSTGQFLSADPLVALTGQPYVYTGDDPVNAIDPNGLDCGVFSVVCGAYDATAGAVKDAAGAIYHHIGLAVELTAAGICIVATTGVCIAAVLGDIGTQLYLQYQAGELNATNIAGTVLLGATDVLTAGIGGLVERIAAEATEGFTETVLYNGVKYTLRVLSVSPSVVIDVSNADEAGAGTSVSC